MTNDVKVPLEVTGKTKSVLVTLNDLLPHIDGARQSPNPCRRGALMELASMAGATLGSTPKGQPRRWTGWIGNEHFWRGRRVILPTGVVAEVYGVQRGQAAVRWPDPYWIEGVRLDVVPVAELTVYRHPAAVVLGKLKGGCKEKFSQCKQSACRLNGAQPVRRGRRPRGRPRRVKLEPATGGASEITTLAGCPQPRGNAPRPPAPPTLSP